MFAAFTFRCSVVITITTAAWGQVPQHTQALNEDFANLYSLSSNIPGVAIEGDPAGAAVIRGIVRTSQGQLAKGAEVWAYGIRGNRIPCREKTTTDQQGRFTLRIPQAARIGKVQWGINVFHGKESVRATNLGPGKQSGGIVRLKPGRSLLLSVRDELGQPVPAFRAYLEDGRVLDHAGAEARRITGLNNGVRSMCILAKGFERQVLHLDTTTVDPTLLEVRMVKGRTIAGTIRDPDGEPLPSCGVSPFYGGNSAVANTALTVLADQRGRYRYAGARTFFQEFVAFACLAKSKQELFEVAPGMNAIDGVDGIIPTPVAAPPALGAIVMLGGGSRPNSKVGAVSGRVVFPDGQPVRNFKLRLEDPRKPPDGTRTISLHVALSRIGILVTDADGRFRVTDIDRNRAIRLTASVSGYLDASKDVVITKDATADPDFTNLTLKLQKPVTVRVNARDDNDRIQWVLHSTHPDKPARAAAYYMRIGARQVRGKRQQVGKLIFEPVEWNDGVLTLLRDRETAAVAWRGERLLKVYVNQLKWVAQ